MAKNGTKRIRVGIIGANPDRGWAAVAHIPALKSLSHDFEITALSTSRRESADAASRLFGVPVAFDNHRDLVNRADVAVVAITVTVPYHLELETAALGEVRELSATMTVRRKSFAIAGTGESKPMTAEDQVLVSGLLESGATFSIHYRGGVSRGTNLLWEINGTEGDLQLTAAGGQAQIFEMTVRGGKGAQSSLEVLPVPEQYRWSPQQGPFTNVAQAYARFARDYREGTHFCPTFDDAVTRHRMLNAIERAAATGQRQTLG